MAWPALGPKPAGLPRRDLRSDIGAMTWFEPVFAALLPASDHIGSIWWLLALAWLGQTVALWCGAQRIRTRLAAAGTTVAVWPLVVPAAPLAGFAGVLPDRVTGLQDEAILVLAMMIGGALGVLSEGWALRRRPFDIARLPAAGALCVMGTLAFFYHVVLMNGMDEAQRAAEARALSEIAALPEPAFAAVCATPGHWCGTGRPETGNPRFDADLAAWFERLEAARAARSPASTALRAASSNGAVTAAPTYVWAAAMRESGEIAWVARSYQPQTEALQLAFRILLAAATVFWVGAALLVEVGHRRAFRRRASRRRSGAHAPAPDCDAMP